MPDRLISPRRTEAVPAGAPEPQPVAAPAPVAETVDAPAEEWVDPSTVEVTVKLVDGVDPSTVISVAGRDYDFAGGLITAPRFYADLLVDTGSAEVVA